MHETSEWPLVTREECWRAFRPASAFSMAGFRRLRSEAVISDGFRVDRRSRGQLVGHARYYSRLNLLAADAFRCGDRALAQTLAERASQVEASPEFIALVEALTMAGVPEPGSAPPPEFFQAPDQGWHLDSLRQVIAAVCSWTDLLHIDSPAVQSRLLAEVHQVRDGQVDLALHMLDTFVVYAQPKLAAIHRDILGAKVFLYIVDLGGADELIRARPAVEVQHVTPARRPGRGLYGDHSVTLTPEQHTQLARLREGTPVRVANLSGLRVRL